MIRRVLLLLASVTLAMAGPVASAQGTAPPPGWGKPPPLPAPTGTGQASFKQGGGAMTLPLQHIEIDTKQPDLILVSLNYVDAGQENKLDRTFGSAPKLGKNDPKPITGFVANTKAKGVSKSHLGRTKCDLAITRLTADEVAGTLSCKGMTDWSGQNAAPDVTDVKFDGKLKGK
jgi:hypothetical protein